MEDQKNSLNGNIYAQVLSDGTLFDDTYPMVRKVDTSIILKKISQSLESLNVSTLMVLRIRTHLEHGSLRASEGTTFKSQEQNHNFQNRTHQRGEFGKCSDNGSALL